VSERLRIATRGSALALWQAHHVRDRLCAADAGASVELVVIKTTGDKILDVPLAKVGGKGLFVKEIERALLDGDADLAVHSMKDVPAELEPGLAMSAISAREDPWDALVTRDGRGFDGLAPGARVGTSSLRRQCQLRALRPDMTIVSLRGNVDTRLRKLDAGDVDGLVMAAAGLLRLGLSHRIAERFDPHTMVPAVGQGAVVAQARVDDHATLETARAIDHAPTRAAVEAERAFLAAMGGGCQRPIGAWARCDGTRLLIEGAVADALGRRIVRARLDAAASQPERAGQALAERARALGADALLTEVAS
jgi:hydroxymethylbilane synthase